MDFRWVAFITLWTMLTGPIFDLSPGVQPASAQRSTPPARVHVHPPFELAAYQ